jgi:hypothetical protein
VTFPRSLAPFRAHLGACDYRLAVDVDYEKGAPGGSATLDVTLDLESALPRQKIEMTISVHEDRIHANRYGAYHKVGEWHGDARSTSLKSQFRRGLPL